MKFRWKISYLKGKNCILPKQMTEKLIEIVEHPSVHCRKYNGNYVANKTEIENGVSDIKV